MFEVKIDRSSQQCTGMDGLLVYTQENSTLTSRKRRIFEAAWLLARSWRVRGYELAVRYIDIDYMGDCDFQHLRAAKRDPVREAMSLQEHWGATDEGRSSNCQG